MCILHVTNLYCNCSMRDTNRCPHFNYIRIPTQAPSLPTTPEPTGYYLRRPRDFQRCDRWEPLPANQTWEHCSTFIRDHLTNPLACPETVTAGDGHIRARSRRDKCEYCVNGHPPIPAGRRNAIAPQGPLLPTQEQETTSEGEGEWNNLLPRNVGTEEYNPCLTYDTWDALMGN
ncbi:hypothetical protein B0T21DRAFT_352707 [Apiosordaria backusii]|uniref:Uncharacterized protein n=1 Tax=Apiosordaria backusii TaxID=314023 RepID=A0AA40A788_9PEZI|nr:hypothetical protein B0T21DRAFT_352707 [Apiosordaria backusii]